MAVELKKDSIDLGIVTRDAGPMVAFYRDLLGFTDEGQMPMPNIGTMTRLRCGTSLIKIVEATPKSDAAPGGIGGSTVAGSASAAPSKALAAPAQKAGPAPSAKQPCTRAATKRLGSRALQRAGVAVIRLKARR